MPIVDLLSDKPKFTPFEIKVLDYLLSEEYDIGTYDAIAIHEGRYRDDVIETVNSIREKLGL